MKIDTMKDILAQEECEADRWIKTGKIKDWPWLNGSVERYYQRRADYPGCFDGEAGERSLRRWIGQEAFDLFFGFENDCDANRASYAASLHYRILESLLGSQNNQVRDTAK